MKMGVEEEYFLIDPSTLFLYPGAPRIGLSLILEERNFINNFSMEFPHSPPALRYPFSIAELKTTPEKDIDSLKNELLHNRGMLRDTCRDNGLRVLASGSHPFCIPSVHGKANCCAFHIHVSEVNLRKVYKILKFFSGPLISVSANSPFLGGKNAYFCSRLTYSPFTGTRDFSIKRNLGTVESRVFDTQITSQRAFSLIAFVATLVTAFPTVQLDDTAMKQIAWDRDYAVKHEFSMSHIRKKLERVLECSEVMGLKEHLNVLFNEVPGSTWQKEIAGKHGFSSLLPSLFESFEKDKRCTRIGNEREISWSNITVNKIPREMPSILAYAPFILYTKLKTYNKNLPSETMRWIKEIFRGHT